MYPLNDLLANDAYISVNKKITRKMWLETAGLLGELLAKRRYYASQWSLDDKGGFFVKYEDIEEELGLGKKKVARIVTDLERVGFLTTKIKHENLKKLKYYYIIDETIITYLSQEELFTVVPKEPTDSPLATLSEVLPEDYGSAVTALYNNIYNTSNNNKNNNNKLNKVYKATVELFSTMEEANAIVEDSFNLLGLQAEKAYIKADRIFIGSKLNLTIIEYSRLIDRYGFEIIGEIMETMVLRLWSQKSRRYDSYNLAIQNRIRRKNPEGKRTEEGRRAYEIIKEANDGIVDGDSLTNANYSTKIVQKISEHTAVASGQFTREIFLETLLGLARNWKRTARKITSPEKVYDNLAELIQDVQGEVKQKASASF